MNEDKRLEIIPENQPESEKTFTQEEVNRIISERLQRERSKIKAMETGEYTAELAEREKKITQRELKLVAKERLQEQGLPVDIVDMLTYEDEQSFEKSFEKAVNIFSQSLNIAVSDRVKSALSGEPPKAIFFTANDPLKQAFAPKK